jgi:hypothetical protein
MDNSLPSTPRFSPISSPSKMLAADPILVAKIDALQKDIDRLLEQNLQMLHMLELILEQSRPHQGQEI